MNLNDRLIWLQGLGCKPCINLWGEVWRAHINGSGNYWDEGKTPHEALESAIKLWEEKGMPMDGYGCSIKN